MRLIPARAGNIPLPQPPPSSSSAHPRPCGEHALFNTAPAALLGSSPLAQGTSTRHRHSVHRRRLIPTRAGNIGRTQSCRQRPSIHPRSRGEHLKALIGGMKWCGSSPLARGTHEEGAQGVFREGSSPLARGTLRWFLWLYPGLRLIPTRAGNTFSSTSCAHLPAAHPRSRGEHLGNFVGTLFAPGSSPLARGTLRSA